MKEKPKTVGTHNGRFHSDEIFAIATLRELYPELKITRTRDQELLQTLDLRVDVGGAYNPETGDFDHHQKEFNEKGPSGIPYSSFGLVWKHYGMKLCGSKTIWNNIEEKLVRYVDAVDNGIEFAKEGMFIYTVGSVIEALFGTSWNEKGMEDERFEEAVTFAQKILRNEIKKGKVREEGEEIVKKAIKEREQEEYVILPQRGLPTKPLLKDPKLKFCLSPRDGEQWTIDAIAKHDYGFERRIYFPKNWAGLSGEELDKETGIPGGIFCHKKLFITVAKNYETALQLTKQAIKENNTSKD